MSGGQYPAFTDAQAFRFISDPGHKENLSGRVRAACLTCRRKKIKCSGEPHCRTCRDRGVECEGFPERKRPRKDGPNASNVGLTSGGVHRKKVVNTSRQSNTSRKAALPVLNDNSHYTDHLSGSSSKSIEDTVSYLGSTSEQSEPIKTDSQRRSNGSRRNSLPAQIHMDTWQSYHTASQEPLNGSTTTPRMGTHTSDSTFIPVEGPGDRSTSVIGNTQEVAEATWCSGNSDGFVAIPAEARTRRQTVACLFPMPELVEPRYRMPSGEHGFLDDTSLLGSHTQGTGFTPGGFSAWLDANASDLASMLPFTNPPDAVNGFHQPTQLPDESGTTSATQVVQNQAYAEDYFNQGWPQ
ncbi:hypothetical protein DOTSEDRAFT_76599 [Dothistroma septosporum NZE10]|uniref:Zn(2)-C6 fungal-type domain-containing protein n=1 Tax=Dothistroma septosporum (strain NZE10 / CBS 128990) TaxID=675120 RepID=N1Q1U0_DOTSN|nr:hypothetical protein DOTSEDRAFT_76599 [Dothistroma septosporum NZE10]